MKGYSMIRLVLVIGIMLAIAGCSSIPLRNGELVISKNTTATIDDLGVARVNNQF